MNEKHTIIHILELSRAMKTVEVGVQTERLSDTEDVRKAWQSAHRERQRIIQSTAQWVTEPLMSNGLPSEAYWRWFEEWYAWAKALTDKQYTLYRNRVLFPTVYQICEYFDCELVWDIFEDKEGKQFPTVSIGSRGDETVGIMPYYLTDGSHHTEQELEDFCRTEPEQIEQKAHDVFLDYPFDGIGVFNVDSSSTV